MAHGHLVPYFVAPVPRFIDGSPAGAGEVGLIQSRILIANLPDTLYGDVFEKEGRSDSSWSWLVVVALSRMQVHHHGGGRLVK